MAQILTEYFPIVLTPEQLKEGVSSSDDKTRMLIKRVLLQRADAKNRNGRIYPKDILEREIKKYNDNFVKNRRGLGELDHPKESSVVELKNVSHLITEMWWEGNEVYGNIEVLDSPDFPSGRIMAGLLKRNIPVGISSRAVGSLETTNEGSIVQDDLALVCFDSVSYESTQGSNMNLQEGIERLNLDIFQSIDDIIHDIICENSGACSCKFK